jgi:hypothetical protein
LSGGNTDVNEGPCVIIRSTIPVIWDTFMSICEYKVVVRVSDVREERFEDFGSEEATRIIDGVVRKKVVGKHMCTKLECYASIGRGEVVGVVCNGSTAMVASRTFTRWSYYKLGRNNPRSARTVKIPPGKI